MATESMRVLRRQAVLDRLGVSHSTLYEWMRTGGFPKPISLGANTRAWLESEITDFLAKRMAERDGQHEGERSKP